ncbi:MAG: extracellular solute-binding protein [Chloroflexi bacterium]|nr:extracellular solute-binding protein [Chloroflexota bacterium]
MRRVCYLLLAGILLMEGLACVGAREEAATPKTVKINPTIPPKSDWEKKWNETLIEARKEGKVIIYNIWGPLVRNAVGEPFSRKYGIEVEWMSFNRGAEMLAKIQTEKVAGLRIADAYGGGATTLVATFKPLGLLGPVEPYLLLPEVLDPKNYHGNAMPWSDKAKTTMAMSLRLTNNIVVNKDLVNPGEFSSIKDLLKPQYKDKVAINDPSVSGSGNAILASLGHTEWNEAEALKFLRDLIANGAVITRDNRLHVEWMARGKYPIGVGAQADSLAEFLEAGAPLVAAVTREALPVTPGAGAIGLPVEPAHPNATTIFLNWLLSKEGQTAFVKGTRQPIMRTDVPLEGIHPIFLPAPGQKLFFQTEEIIAFQGNIMKPAGDIIAGR